MEWLSQNWIWVLVIIGALWLVSRSRYGSVMGCGRGAAHERHGEAGAAGTDTPTTAKQAADQRTAQSAASAHHHRGGCC